MSIAITGFSKCKNKLLALIKAIGYANCKYGEKPSFLVLSKEHCEHLLISNCDPPDWGMFFRSGIEGIPVVLAPVENPEMTFGVEREIGNHVNGYHRCNGYFRCD